MRGIYLASYRALHENYNIDYQDINDKRDIGGCMLEIDLNDYDYIIATPPCNYYSRANYRRDTSEYSQKTKHLLPDIIKKLESIGKPFIVENVINKVLMRDIIDSFSGYYYEHGRHSYFTNIKLDLKDIPQEKENIRNRARVDRQGGINVFRVIECWLSIIHEKEG